MVNTKAFYVLGIIIFYIALGLILTEIGIDHTSTDGFEDGDTPNLPDSSTGIVLGFWDILLGIFTFELSTDYYIPVWINIILWIPLLSMIVLIYELIRGN